MPGGALDMDGETQTRRDLPGVRGYMEFIKPVAGPGDGGDAPGVAASGFDGESSGVEPTSCGIVGAEEQGRDDERVGATFGPTPRGPGQAGGAAGGCGREEGLTIFGEIEDGTKGTCTQEGEAEKIHPGLESKSSLHVLDLPADLDHILSLLSKNRNQLEKF